MLANKQAIFVFFCETSQKTYVKSPKLIQKARIMRTEVVYLQPFRRCGTGQLCAKLYARIADNSGTPGLRI